MGLFGLFSRKENKEAIEKIPDLSTQPPLPGFSNEEYSFNDNLTSNTNNSFDDPFNISSLESKNVDTKVTPIFDFPKNNSFEDMEKDFKSDFESKNAFDNNLNQNNALINNAGMKDVSSHSLNLDLDETKIETDELYPEDEKLLQWEKEPVKEKTNEKKVTTAFIEKPKSNVVIEKNKFNSNTEVDELFSDLPDFNFDESENEKEIFSKEQILPLMKYNKPRDLFVNKNNFIDSLHLVKESKNILQKTTSKHAKLITSNNSVANRFKKNAQMLDDLQSKLIFVEEKLVG
jgi:hypothetical protein